MKIITTWNDTIALNAYFHTFIGERFKELYNTYRELDSPSLTHFSLSAYGEILIAESYEEIKGMLFEEVRQVALDSGALYVGVWLKNDEVCCDVVIAHAILTNEQIKLIETEL